MEEFDFVVTDKEARESIARRPWHVRARWAVRNWIYEWTGR